MKSFEERFWAKVEKTNHCWLWKGAVTGSGYGTIRGPNHKMIMAHRAAYELLFRPLVKGEQVLHSCDVKLCVRHLFVGSQKDNMHDMIQKGRAAKGTALNHPIQTGENNHAAKLNWSIVENIRNDFDNNKLSQSAIMRKYNLSRSQVWLLVHRKTWV